MVSNLAFLHLPSFAVLYSFILTVILYYAEPHVGCYHIGSVAFNLEDWLVYAQSFHCLSGASDPIVRRMPCACVNSKQYPPSWPLKLIKEGFNPV